MTLVIVGLISNLGIVSVCIDRTQYCHSLSIWALANEAAQQTMHLQGMLLNGLGIADELAWILAPIADKAPMMDRTVSETEREAVVQNDILSIIRNFATSRRLNLNDVVNAAQRG